MSSTDASAAGLAVAARGAQRGRASPDDDDPLLGPHASKTSMTEVVVGVALDVGEAQALAQQRVDGIAGQRIDGRRRAVVDGDQAPARAPAILRSRASAASSVGRSQ